MYEPSYHDGIAIVASSSDGLCYALSRRIVTLDSQILTVDEAAEKLKLSPAGVRRLIREGAIRAAKIGAGQPGYRILASELERFVRGEPVPCEGAPS